VDEHATYADERERERNSPTSGSASAGSPPGGADLTQTPLRNECRFQHDSQRQFRAFDAKAASSLPVTILTAARSLNEVPDSAGLHYEIAPHPEKRASPIAFRGQGTAGGCLGGCQQPRPARRRKEPTCDPGTASQRIAEVRASFFRHHFAPPEANAMRIAGSDRKARRAEDGVHSHTAGVLAL
jgi:hypothetical protein